jgi:hypothetical protein
VVRGGVILIPFQSTDIKTVTGHLTQQHHITVRDHVGIPTVHPKINIESTFQKINKVLTFHHFRGISRGHSPDWLYTRQLQAQPPSFTSLHLQI